MFLVWGLLMVGGGYHVITNEWSWEVIFAALPLGLSITTIIFGKHIDKLKADRSKRIYTLPVIMGDKMARLAAVQFMAFQYILVIINVLMGFYSPILLIVFFAIPTFVKAVRVFSYPAPAACPSNFPRNVWPLWFVGHAFRHYSIFGMLFILGCILDTALVKYRSG